MTAMTVVHLGHPVLSGYFEPTMSLSGLSLNSKTREFEGHGSQRLQFEISKDVFRN